MGAKTRSRSVFESDDNEWELMIPKRFRFMSFFYNDGDDEQDANEITPTYGLFSDWLNPPRQEQMFELAPTEQEKGAPSGFPELWAPDNVEDWNQFFSDLLKSPRQEQMLEPAPTEQEMGAPSGFPEPWAPDHVEDWDQLFSDLLNPPRQERTLEPAPTEQEKGASSVFYEPWVPDDWTPDDWEQLKFLLSKTTRLDPMPELQHQRNGAEGRVPDLAEEMAGLSIVDQPIDDICSAFHRSLDSLFNVVENDDLGEHAPQPQQEEIPDATAAPDLQERAAPDAQA